ncbi:LuxR C-terminal-related transcriptional regulator [Alcanivorax sp. S6407]|uniref:LuxR C-terminal-related transcriptional regulator n=1 Tax=Alcanivorax sp. S6407 TaxID=2926424 RepID=UPI001FF1D337|nr:LuxR C-terminal-related transcriptional regulator [Alcanivorax sp. S6407]
MTSAWQDLSNRELHSAINSLTPWQTAEGLAALLELARRTLNADSTSWLITFSGDYGRDTPVIDWMEGWKVMDVAHWQTGREEYWQYVDACQIRIREAGVLTPLTVEAIRHVGSHRCHRLSQLEQSAGQNDGRGRDRLSGVYHLNNRAESYLLADRTEGNFSDSENHALMELILSFPRLQHWLMLERGLARQCERPLSPRQQQLVHLLLQPFNKAEIAERMGLAQSTVHSYTIALYRNFHVGSRHELMSLWLSAPQDATTTKK